MNRIDKVNQQVKREVGLILQQELNDPRLQFVSITNVNVSKDLRNAKIYYSVLGTEENVVSAGEALHVAGSRIRGLISKRLNLRYTPELSFYYDESIDASIRIEETLKEIHDVDE